MVAGPERADDESGSRDATITVLADRSALEARHGSERRPDSALVPLTDALAVSIAVASGQFIDLLLNNRGTVGSAFESLLYVPVLLAVMACYGLYRRGARRLVDSSFPDIGHIIHSGIVGSLLVMVLAAAGHRWAGLPNVDRTGITFTALIAILCVPAGRMVTRWVARRHDLVMSNVLIVGSGEVADAVLTRLQKVDGIRIVGCVDDNEAGTKPAWRPQPLLGGLADIPSIVTRKGVDHVVVAFSPARGAELATLLRPQLKDVRVSIVPRLFEIMSVNSRVDELYGLPVIDVAPAAFGLVDRIAKRALDLLVSSVFLVLGSPLLLAIALGVTLTSPGPILFKQQRTGRGGAPFSIYKFRTMYDGAHMEKRQIQNDVDGPLFKSHNDPRVTAIGRFLRRTSLDELPQLINVFKGDMSLVGPRPFEVSEAEAIDGWASRRFDVRPGMTGLWQVSGRNDLPFEELCRLDHCYVASWSLWWDLRIIWHTPGILLRREGAY